MLNAMASERIRWTKPKLDRDTLRRLAAKNDMRAWVQILSEIGLVAGSGILAHHAFANWSLAVSIPLLYLYLVFYSWLTREGTFHELIHGTPFSSKRVNEFFFRFVTFFGWMNGDFVRAGHMRHHQNTLHEGRDQDVALDMKFNTVFEIPMALTFHARHFARDLGTLIRFAMGRVESELDLDLFPASNNKARKRLFRTSRLTLAGHSLLIVLFAVTGNWLLILTVSLGAFWATWSHLLPSMTQHVGMQRNVNDWRLNSRSIKVGPLTYFFYWRMQYHIEHHMYPSVPFYNLRHLRREIEEYLPERRTMIGAWIDIVRYLKRYKTDPNAFIEVDDVFEM